MSANWQNRLWCFCICFSCRLVIFVLVLWFWCTFIIYIANGDDLSRVKLEQSEMRHQLADCFSKSCISSFPHRIIPTPVHSPNQATISVYCDCELPEEYDNMVQCDYCDFWYHLIYIYIYIYIYIVIWKIKGWTTQMLSFLQTKVMQQWY